MTAVKQRGAHSGYKKLNYVHPYKRKQHDSFTPAPCLEQEIARNERVKFFKTESARREIAAMFELEAISFGDPLVDAMISANQAYTNGVESTKKAVANAKELTEIVPDLAKERLNHYLELTK